ncbi:hypothetical protein AA14_24305 [Salmonella enterica]|nr:hypothetical protein [Salmonella enterica]ECX6012006.1 hypothetical protein [Salmonella enterica subsp. enterica serovar Rubislaw]EEJ9527349.1 hypothetical protein [Salmonella enterica subsp. enterica serovar Rubislaw]
MNTISFRVISISEPVRHYPDFYPYGVYVEGLVESGNFAGKQTFLVSTQSYDPVSYEYYSYCKYWECYEKVDVGMIIDGIISDATSDEVILGAIVLSSTCINSAYVQGNEFDY